MEALIRLAAESPGDLTIVCIGPLTNIATATVKDPTFVDNVKALYVMGGSNNARGNITAAAEFNFYVDPEVAKAFFTAGFDITVIPWAPLTLERAVFGPDQLAEIEALGTPLSNFFTRVCATTLDFERSVGINGTTHPDSLTAAGQSEQAEQPGRGGREGAVGAAVSSARLARAALILHHHPREATEPDRVGDTAGWWPSAARVSAGNASVIARGVAKLG